MKNINAYQQRTQYNGRVNNMKYTQLLEKQMESITTPENNVILLQNISYFKTGKTFDIFIIYAKQNGKPIISNISKVPVKSLKGKERCIEAAYNALSNIAKEGLPFKFSDSFTFNELLLKKNELYVNENYNGPNLKDYLQCPDCEKEHNYSCNCKCN